MKNVIQTENKIITFRWFFYISTLQLVAFLIGPMLIFPSKFVIHIEIISAMTLGLIVALFYLLVNIFGLVLDRERRRLYWILIAVISLWFLWAIITWSFIEHMDYILR
ncbi:MAG: hypothetical protein ABIJ45_08645 [Candidatus Zixiibacteriota bacterium]